MADFAENVRNAPGGDLPLPAGAAAALDRAMALLDPYTTDDRIDALWNKIDAIAHATSTEDRIGKAGGTRTEVYKAAMEAEADRVAVRKATQDAQLEYLRATSPEAAARWEAARDQRLRSQELVHGSRG